MSYTPAQTTGWDRIETVTISNQANVEMDLVGTRALYAIHLSDIIPITDATELLLRLSTDGGSTFLSGASDYSWFFRGATEGSSQYSLGDASDTEISITADADDPNGIALMGTSTAESLNGWIYFYNTKQATKVTNISTDIVMREDSILYTHTGAAGLKANIDIIDAIQLRASSGNLSTGRVILYGRD